MIEQKGIAAPFTVCDFQIYYYTTCFTVSQLKYLRLRHRMRFKTVNDLKAESGPMWSLMELRQLSVSWITILQ